MIDRHDDLSLVRAALRRSRVVALLGPRQCGKTTLARQFVSPQSLNYFDLEDPQSLARLSEPNLALRPLRKLVVIDEIQRRPDLFPLLRVLADRSPLPARFLILGSASTDLLRQSSETLAGRLETIRLKASVSPIWVRLPKGGTGCGEVSPLRTRLAGRSTRWRGGGSFCRHFSSATCLS